MAILHERPDYNGTVKKPEIGMWATQCCHRSLYEIISQHQIDIILEDWDDGISHDVFLSEKEALLIIRKGWDDPREIALIDKMLKDLK